MANGLGVITVTITSEHSWRYWSLRQAAYWFRLMRGKPVWCRLLMAVYLGALRVKVGG